ncbi:AraC-like DNA-binding protein [Povalibacter uvarum]|uniref:AraC-like DNA-binding protein n=1 Tax=Povalibacter uvarum TaxID=732238 RepID=A0A841HWT2_9GAMM|nr:helix-turn-helix domain-containing protein [Povalibacter uvarum]MBB6096378.1 AraC-like DNA-binding protein [Povalibacter uvarum]
METVSLAVAGFSIVIAALLLLAYVGFIETPNKSAYSILSCAVLLGALAALQIGHMRYFTAAQEPLHFFYYRLALFMAPATFYFFGRWAVLPGEPFRPLMLLHLVPVLLVFLPRLEISLPILFLLGAGYSLWLANLVYELRARRRQFRFEIFYFAVMSAMAIIVLALGFAIPYIDHDYFYLFYCNAIGAAFAIMVVALIANPDLLAEVTEAARARYGASTLRDVDVDATLKKLESLMSDPKVYQNESLSLSTLASELGVSGHQLSELVNARIGVGFSRYVRERRVAAAKELLLSAPSQSILSISMDTGFRSQSSFYAAFREVTGQSPGDYRKMNLRTPE